MNPLRAHAPSPVWVCPFCHQDLNFIAADKAWLCDKGHSFDCAKEGYVNLLPSNKKHSSDPGDSAEMIAARRNIHGAEIYRPLADAVLAEIAAAGSPASILDLGCGEGYYAGAMQRAFADAKVCGVDISKSAVRLAAKHYPDIEFAVASSFALPVAPASQDVVVRIFAPSQDSEILRVLKPGGLYLEVTPAPRHLWALREALYDVPKAHEDSREKFPYLQRIQSSNCEYEVDLSQRLLRELLAMTPFAHRGHREKRERLRNGGGLNVGMAFSLRLFKKPDIA
ncbi:MAG: 23S rRNA (guanine745-N1)-methyltransferase [Halioglobus sp.]|jgi:23S rRNA (guanine745-N1)-methyltransferase